MPTNPITHIINNILPKDMKIDYNFWKDKLNKEVLNNKEGYNLALADCRAKLPEVLDYVYAEFRKEVEDERLPQDTRMETTQAWQSDGYNSALDRILSLLSTNQK